MPRETFGNASAPVRAEARAAARSRPLRRNVSSDRPRRGRAASGVWTCTPGTIQGEFLTDEVSVILAGHMTVTAEGRTVEVRAGDVLTMRKGLQVEWVIHEQVTKAWNVSSPDPLPF